MTLAEEHRKLAERVALLERLADAVGEHGELRLTVTNVGAALDALNGSLASSLQDRIALHDLVDGLQTAVSEVREEYERMRTALGTIQQELAAGSVDRADMQTKLALVIGAWDKQRRDQEAIRKRRERQEEEDRAERRQQAERLRWLIGWGLGAIAAIGISTLMLEIGTAIEHSGGLTAQGLWVLVAVGAGLLLGAGLWVRFGWGLRPGQAHTPHIVHPPHTHHTGGPQP